MWCGVGMCVCGVGVCESVCEVCVGGLKGHLKVSAHPFIPFN